jgi:hypothetical protein
VEGRGGGEVSELLALNVRIAVTESSIISRGINELTLTMVKKESIRRPKGGSDIATRDYTVHMSKRLYGVNFKKRAPRAIAEIRKFAQKAMGTK